ncbi:hypothetical protein ACHWQZ_G008029 [Mnemiopsis leidyi]
MVVVGRMQEGQYTQTIYNYIKQGQYVEAIDCLLPEYENNNTSRAALSLLGYCYYQIGDFVSAADCYGQLIQIFPEHEQYKIYYAQSLQKSCQYEAAMKASFTVDNPTFKEKVVKLQAAIKYDEDDLPGAKSMVEQCSSDDPDTENNLGCLLVKEKRYAEACKKFNAAMNVKGYQPHLSYNIALCHYYMKQYALALKNIADIIEKGIREHPELSVGMQTEGIDVRSVGNSLTLHETALVEAFNLKAAIEYQLKNFEGAQEALTDMPPRSEEELDCVTLHNQALMNMDSAPTTGFEKLQFLLQQNECPPETFGNLLLLYVKHQYFDQAADVMAENTHLTFKMDPYLYEYLDAIIVQQSSPEEAFRRFDDIANRHTDNLRKITKQVQECRQNNDEAAVKKAVNEYDEALEKYIPVLMAQAKIYWDKTNYNMVEKIFRKSVEFCNEHDSWKLNVAHVLFMQENKYKEAIGFYEPIVKKHYDNILSVSAIVLANLCVSYIMTSQNEEAEDLMRKIEKEEEQMGYEDPERKIYHLCIVNLVIGTLYCAKGNFEFGITRVIKSMEPYSKKLGMDTWHYAKRCFLGLIENLAKHMIMVRDVVLQDCIQFLEHAELYGKNVACRIQPPLNAAAMHEFQGKNTVTYEARLIKGLLLLVCDL